MPIGPIKLTEFEQEIAFSIIFDPPMDFGPERSHENGELSARLLASLMKRRAIPDCRLRYFADPAYHAENTRSSRYELFRRKVSSDEDMYRNPHFLKYLRYFIKGAELPEPVQKTFHNKTQEHFVKVGELSLFARSLLREVRKGTSPLERHELPEKFYKLALDCDCDAWDAKAIRRAVMQVK